MVPGVPPATLDRIAADIGAGNVPTGCSVIEYKEVFGVFKAGFRLSDVGGAHFAEGVFEPAHVVSCNLKED